MEKIHVTVRARPLSQEDAKTCPWQIIGNSIFFSNNSLKFDFDQVLGEDCKNVEVYQSRTKKIVSTAVRGFNGTVFAYGQTNSGKTLLRDFQEIFSEFQGSKDDFKDVSSLVHELLECFSVSVKTFSEFRSLMSQSTIQLRSTISNYENVHHCLKHKVTELEDEKLCLHSHSADLNKQIEELKLRAENSENAFNKLVDQHDLEKSELLSQFQILEKEISTLSASSMARENGSLRKDLDKTKTKLKDTESKLKNAIQEKTKLEGEKASAERKIKLLHGQKSFLERETNKCESLAGKRRESSVDRSSTVLDPKKGRGYAIPFETVQEDYKDLKVLAFEMEATIASLEEQLAAAQGEKEVAINNNESLSLELESLMGKLNTFESELFAKQEEVSSLSCRLEESNSYHRKSENLMNMLVDEKEEMATQLANALLEMEEEKAIWSAKEKGRMEAMEEKAKSYNAEVLSLTNRLLEMSKAKDKVEDLSSLISSMEVKAQKDERNNKNEMAKVRMRLHWTDKKLKAITERHRETVTEGDLMRKKFEEASAKLKEKLSTTLDKNLKLRKQIVANK